MMPVVAPIPSTIRVRVSSEGNQKEKIKINLLRIFYVPSEENDAARSYNTLETKETTASEMYTNTTAMTRQKTSNATHNPITAQKP
jgi:hypothetical protein